MTWCSLKGALELAAEFATSKRPLSGVFVGGLRALPYPAFHGGAVALARLEEQVRHPFSSRWAESDAWREMSAVDCGSDPSQQLAQRHFDYTQHVWAADMGTLLLHLRDGAFREHALTIEDLQALDGALATRRGAVVAGLHLGPHAALPLALAQLGYNVSVIGAPSILEMGKRLSSACLPEAASRLRWLPLGDQASLLRARTALRGGSVVVAFVEQIVPEGSRTAEVTLFGQRVRTSTMLPYLASLANSAIVPASIVSAPGPRFTLRFESPLPPPARTEHATQETLQRLFNVAEARAREHPEQWLLWNQLAAVCGMVSEPSPAVARQQPAYAPLS